ncbi:MAG: hypothetical protein WEE64_09575 [Dehalococcoidia bacterium]
MLEPEPQDDLLSRPEFRAGASAVVGGVVGGLIVLIVVLMFGGDDGGNGDDEQVVTTPAAATATQAAGATPQPSAAPTVTTTPAGPTDPVEALEAFLSDEFGEPHIGDCPQEIPPSGVPDGYCSTNINDSNDLKAYFIGPPFSEGVGEVVLTRRPDGSWDATFVAAPPLGELISVGKDAMVYGTGSCLRFHPEPKQDSPVTTCKFDGTTAPVVEGPVEDGDVTWWRLEGLGWGSGQFLSPPAP